MPSEPTHNLPGVITSIAVQKKNKERYSLFVNEEFLMGVAGSTLIKFELAKGVELTPLLYQKLQREEGYHAAKSYVLKLLGRRDHARKELLTKALRKDYPEEVILNILDELEQKGYINERSFAEKFAADKLNLNQWGPVKIRSHLLKKGIDKQTIRHSIEKAFEPIELKETFLNLVLKRKSRFLREEDPIKRKKKVLDYLCRKGFKPGSIFDCLDELTEAVAE